MNEGGRFIVFEGIDGAGTTTQAALLSRWLRGEGHRVLETAEPSTGPIGTTLRQALGRRLVGVDGDRLDAKAIALLFAADRSDHLRGEIEPALAAGTWVVCDRYVHSSLAYQGVECDPAWVAQLNAPMRSPDLVIHLRVSAEVAAKRRAGRGGRDEIYEVDAFQRQVVQRYEEAPTLRPQDPVVVIDGAATAREVQRAVRAVIRSLDA